MVFTCAWCLLVYGVYMCMVFTCAWCLIVHGVYLYMVFTCAWCLLVHGVYLCMVFTLHIILIPCMYKEVWIYSIMFAVTFCVYSCYM